MPNILRSLTTEIPEPELFQLHTMREHGIDKTSIRSAAGKAGKKGLLIMMNQAEREN